MLDMRQYRTFQNDSLMLVYHWSRTVPEMYAWRQGRSSRCRAPVVCDVLRKRSKTGATAASRLPYKERQNLHVPSFKAFAFSILLCAVVKSMRQLRFVTSWEGRCGVNVEMMQEHRLSTACPSPGFRYRATCSERHKASYASSSYLFWILLQNVSWKLRLCRSGLIERTTII